MAVLGENLVARQVIENSTLHLLDNPGHHLLLKDTSVTNVFQGEMSSIMLMNNINMFLDPRLPLYLL